eukprot:s2465_g7.t1
MVLCSQFSLSLQLGSRTPKPRNRVRIQKVPCARRPVARCGSSDTKSSAHDDVRSSSLKRLPGEAKCAVSAAPGLARSRDASTPLAESLLSVMPESNVPVLSDAHARGTGSSSEVLSIPLRDVAGSCL